MTLHWKICEGKWKLMFCILAKDFKKHQPTATTTTSPNNNISTMAKDQQEDSSCQTEEGNRNRNSNKKMKQTNKKVNNCTWWDLLICITSINKASWLLRNLKRRKAVFVLQKSLEFEGRQNNNDSCCCMRSGNIIMFLICPSSLLSLLTVPACCCMLSVKSTNDDLLVLHCDGFFLFVDRKSWCYFCSSSFSFSLKICRNLKIHLLGSIGRASVLQSGGCEFKSVS